jgi:hypothetical protein
MANTYSYNSFVSLLTDKLTSSKLSLRVYWLAYCTDSLTTWVVVDWHSVIRKFSITFLLLVTKYYSRLSSLLRTSVINYPSPHYCLLIAVIILFSVSPILWQNWLAFSVTAIGPKALPLSPEHELNVAAQCWIPCLYSSWTPSLSRRRLCVSSNFVTDDDDVNLARVDRIATPSVCFHKPAPSTQQQYLLTYSQFRKHITLFNTVLIYLINALRFNLRSFVCT